MSLYGEKKQGAFHDLWEEEVPNRESIVRGRLDEYVRYARLLPFYKDRCEGYDPKSKFPLKDVPVLTAASLRVELPPLGRGVLTREMTDFSVFQSGGTTGLPKTTLFSHQELEGINQGNSRGFFALGLKDSDRVANLWAVGGLYMTFIHMNRCLQQYGCLNFPFSNQTPVDFIHSIVKLFQINCLTGITSVVLNAVRGMSSLGLEGIKIDKIFYGGEHIYEADKAELRKKLGVLQIAAPGYGTVDTWYLGYQCSQCPTGVFHAHDDQTYLEIVEPATGRHCEVKETGMIYATPFPRKLTPIIRYQVGDLGFWIGENCPCGRSTPLFKLLGRGDDVLRIGYDSINYIYLQELATQMKGLSGTIQMEKKREQGKDKLVIRIETEAAIAEHASLKAEFEKQLLEERPSLREFIKKETVHPLWIELLKPGSIPRNSRTGKLIRVIDAI